GSGGSVRYDGARLASKHDVVVVTVNHRLNVFGFLYLAEIAGERFADSGNAGMLDLVAALRWVRENIGAFGGDPGKVTLFGQGAKVLTLMTMPGAAGLFHRAIAQSGVELRPVTAEEATATAERVLRQLGLAPAQADRLQALPPERLVAVCGA